MPVKTAKCRLKACGKVRPISEMRPFKIGRGKPGWKCKDHDNHGKYFSKDNNPKPHARKALTE